MRSLPQHAAADRGEACAFSLIEVTVAIGIAAIVLLAILGLISNGIRASRASVEENRAANLATAIIADRIATPYASNSVTYSLPALTNGMATQTGTFGVGEDYRSAQADMRTARYRVEYRIVAPAAGRLDPYFGAFRIMWPASAAVPEGVTEIAASFPQP